MTDQNPQIERTSFVFTIDEYGKRVRQYSDKDKTRFDKTIKQMITDHLENYSRQGTSEVKNITIQINTY